MFNVNVIVDTKSWEGERQQRESEIRHQIRLMSIGLGLEAVAINIVDDRYGYWTYTNLDRERSEAICSIVDHTVDFQTTLIELPPPTIGEQITRDWDSEILPWINSVNSSALGNALVEYLGEWSMTSDGFSDLEVQAAQKMLLDFRTYFQNM